MKAWDVITIYKIIFHSKKSEQQIILFQRNVILVSEFNISCSPSRDAKISDDSLERLRSHVLDRSVGLD